VAIINVIMLNFHHRKTSRPLPAHRQPDSLKLTCQLAALKTLHGVLAAVEEKYGDKSSERVLFIKGVQGRVAKPWAHRDYTYYLAKIEEVREHLRRSCAPSVLAELAKCALDVYNRFDNRRRMGDEIALLCVLCNRASPVLALPDKYESATFVLEMLVSYRHRFQKPEKNYFWSRQSEALIGSTVASARHLTSLKLAVASDALLRCVAANARSLTELEVQLSLDATDEGLMALADKTSVSCADYRSNPAWLSASRGELGHEWFVKDSLLFTTPSPTATTLATIRTEKRNEISLAAADRSQWRDTGLGCKNLVKLRINGDFVYPPAKQR